MTKLPILQIGWLFHARGAALSDGWEFDGNVTSIDVAGYTFHEIEEIWRRWKEWSDSPPPQVPDPDGLRAEMVGVEEMMRFDDFPMTTDKNSGPHVSALVAAWQRLDDEDRERERPMWWKAKIHAIVKDHEEAIERRQHNDQTP